MILKVINRFYWLCFRDWWWSYNAKLKLKNKNLDAIVMNSLNDDGSGFDSDTNQVIFITELISKKINSIVNLLLHMKFLLKR